jgi:hypothetical protein
VAFARRESIMPVRWFASVAIVVIALGAGCADWIGRGPGEHVANPAHKAAPTINPNQLAYDPDTRTLHLYELIADPGSGRKAAWEVRLPDRTVAYPSGKIFRVPPGVSESEVVIRAYDPPGPPSPGLRLADVPRRKSQQTAKEVSPSQ